MTQSGEGQQRVGKSAAAFRTTGEAAAELDVPAYVLRFWEAKFPQVRPLKRGGGRRYYRPEDIALLRRIRQCLYREGYTIRGVQKLLRDGALRGGQERPTAAVTPRNAFASVPADGSGSAADPASSSAALRATLADVRRELAEIRTLLDAVLAL